MMVRWGVLRKYDGVEIKFLAPNFQTVRDAIGWLCVYSSVSVRTIPFVRFLFFFRMQPPGKKIVISEPATGKNYTPHNEKKKWLT